MTKPIKHFTTGVVVLTDTKPTRALLVHHRKYGTWLQPGGHVESDENPIEAGIREVQEETGLDVAAYMPSMQFVDDKASSITPPNYILEERIDARPDEAEHYHIDLIYVVRIPEQTVAHNIEESHDIGWFTFEELDNLKLFENTRYILRQEMTK